MSHDRVYQRLREHLAYLKLSAAAEVLAGKLDAAQKAKPSYTAFAERISKRGSPRRTDTTTAASTNAGGTE